MKSRGIASFTLIELMAATAVLSSVLLLMVGMQDQMSRAWNNANRRTETGREARAALRMMASDLAALKTRRATSGPVANLVAGDVISGPIPFYYYGGGAGSVRLTISQRLAGASFLFGVVPKANGELNLVGYYVARRTTTNLNGLVQDNAHLMRYRRDAAATASSLSAYFGNTSSASALFSGINSATDEILAYNVAGLSILAMGDTTIINSNGLNFTLPEVTNQGCRFHVTLHLYPEEIAQRLSTSDWTNSANLSKFSRSYEFRLRPLTRPQE